MTAFRARELWCFVCPVFFLLALTHGRAALISEVQHKKLPVLQKTVVFLKADPANWDAPQFSNLLFNPGIWKDVSVIAGRPPVATISGYRFDTLFETAQVHILSFPPALRPRVAEVARAAQPILASTQDDKDSLLLTDGTVLRKYSVQKAFPTGALLEHEGGVRLVTLDDLPQVFYKTHRVQGPYLYLRDLTLPTGEKMNAVRIAVAKDGQTCRITHDAGNRAAQFADFPEDVQALLREHLIAKGVFADEIIIDPSLRDRKPVRKVAASPSTPIPTPSPTPAPVLRRISQGHYATLPLIGGPVISDARILSLGSNDVTIFSPSRTFTSPWDKLPAEVREDVGEATVKLLYELLDHGLAAKDRCPIYGMESKGGADFVEAAKGASGGTVLVRVGVGFLVQEGRWKANGGGAVQLPKPLGGVTCGFVLEEDFVHLGRKGWREWWLGDRQDPLAGVFDEDRRQMRFDPVALGAETVLLDPFEGKYTLFGNRSGVMKRAWRFSQSTRPNLAIVESQAGLYLGVLTERMELPESKMTWEQLLAHRSGTYNLVKVNQRVIQKDSTLFQLVPMESEAQALMQSLDRMRVLPAHYRTLAEKGMGSLMSGMDVAQAEGLEVAANGDSGNYGHEKEVQIERLTVQFESLSADTAVVNVVVQRRERDVERRRNKDGTVTISQGQWRAKKQQHARELELDADGGLRFTDGKAIYDLSFPKIGGFQMATYEIKSNPLSKSVP